MSWAESAYIVETLKRWLSDGTGSGVPCNPCTNVAAKNGGQDKIVLTWYNGQDLTVGTGDLEQVIARSFGVTIVAREERPPRNVRDGVVLYQDPMDPMLTYLDDYPKGSEGPLRAIVTAPSQNKVVYYGVFARTDHGVLNYDTSQVVGMISPGGMYGFRQMYHEPLTYNVKPLHGAAAFKPVRGLQPGASWGTGPTLGGWEQDPWFKEIKPYMVNRHGRADYALDPVDPTRRLSGGGSDATNPNYSGGCFVWIPKVYVREYLTNAAEYRRGRIFEMTPNATLGKATGKTYTNFVNPCFFNKNGQEVEGLWLAMYPFSDSLSGSSASDGRIIWGKNASDIMEMQGWKAYDSDVVAFYGGAFMRLMRDLSYMVAQTTEIQSAFGFGYCNRTADFEPVSSVTRSNPASPGFYGTLGYDKPVQAFYSNVIASHDYWTIDPYTILDTQSNTLMVCDNWKYRADGTGYRWTERKWYGNILEGWSEGMRPLYAETSDKYWEYLSEYWVQVGDGAEQWAKGSGDYVYNNAGSARYIMPRRGGCGKLLWESGPGCISWYPVDGRDGWQTAALVLIPPVGYKPTYR